MTTPEDSEFSHAAPQTAEKSRTQREHAIRELARGVTEPVASPAPSRSRFRLSGRSSDQTQRRWRIFLTGALALVIVTSALLGGAYTLRSSPQRLLPRPRSGPLSFSPWAHQMDCIHDVAWSPSGAQIAVLGYELDCPSLDGPGNSVSGLLVIFDASRGSAVKEISLDNLITPHITIPPKLLAAGVSPSFAFSGINYSHLLWLPDQRHLAITFTTKLATGPLTATGWPLELIEGALILDTSNATGAQNRVVQRTLATLTSTLIEWNLTDGAPLPISTSLISQTAQATISPALTYQWQNSGVLAPQAPLPLGASQPPPPPPSGPVGVPDGGNTFTLWQPGVLSDHIATSMYDLPPLPAYTYSTAFDALSPNGNYLIEGVSISALLSLPTVEAPTPANSSPYGWSHAPVTQARDSALRTNYAVITKHPFISNSEWGVNGELVAWSPNGDYLAVSDNTPDHHVTLYNTSTGASVQQLLPDTNNTPTGNSAAKEPGEANVLRWAPNSQDLLLIDTTYGTATIWHV